MNYTTAYCPATPDEYLGNATQELDNNMKKETTFPATIACYCLLNNLPRWQARIER